MNDLEARKAAAARRLTELTPETKPEDWSGDDLRHELRELIDQTDDTEVLVDSLQALLDDWKSHVGMKG